MGEEEEEGEVMATTSDNSRRVDDMGLELGNSTIEAIGKLATLLRRYTEFRVVSANRQK